MKRVITNLSALSSYKPSDSKYEFSSR